VLAFPVVTEFNERVPVVTNDLKTLNYLSLFGASLQFVAHPNCQQHLTSIWYGPQMGFMQSLNLWKKLLMWVVCVPLMPLFCIVYIIAPDCKVGARGGVVSPKRFSLKSHFTFKRVFILPTFLFLQIVAKVALGLSEFQREDILK